MSPKRLFILGSTGSIGVQALQVVGEHSDRLQVVGLAAYSDWETLAHQAKAHGASVCSLVDPAAASAAADALPDRRVVSGADGLRQLVADTEVDLVVAAISGGAGLLPTVAALHKGVDVALANKEPLVMAGELVIGIANRTGARLLPVDSELSAVFQCLQGQPREAIARILLTASGGPFSELPHEELNSVTPERALRHPNWTMGPKVTIDSATLANKGFEVFEARWLFGVSFPQIEILIHRQSIVHSLVEFRDTSVLAQLGWPDMRVPIQYALLYPERAANALSSLDLLQASPLTFVAPDVSRFPCLRLAREAAAAGGGYPAVLNGADEMAVELFLGSRIGFMDIPRVIENALAAYDGAVPSSVDDVLLVDAWARSHVSMTALGR
jgi:1-deoxy-D-xylulose-5-phosphate reductoisomerase